MKKLVFILISVLSSFTFAQDMEQWVWEDYKMKFMVPWDFEIQESSSSKFSASNANMNMTIFPRKNESTEYDDLDNSLWAWAYNSGCEIDKEGTQFLSNLNGYWGVICNATKSGYNILLMHIVDPDYPQIGLYVWLSYNDKSINTATSVCMSFTPN